MTTKSELNDLFKDLLSNYPEGLSSTSTRKFDDIKKFFAGLLSITTKDVYPTGSGTRPSNLEVRLSQGLQATKHTK